MADLMRRRMNKSAAWSGELALGPMSAVFVGQGGITPLHFSIAHKIIVGAKRVEVTGSIGAPHGFVKAGIPHRIYASGDVIAIIVLDARRYDEVVALQFAQNIEPTSVNQLRAENIVADIRRLPANNLPCRVLRAIDLIDETECIADAAAKFGLSEGQFSRFIKKHLGTPPQKWRNWLMLRRALDRIVEGQDVTNAAFEAGFADASHFSRSCNQHFGIRPSVFRNGNLKLYPSPEDCRDVFETY